MVLFFFIDGLGAGVGDPEVNPLAARPGLLTFFSDGTQGPALPEGARCRLVDATLGVPGRPQSATGHTTILTGRNAAAHLGRHHVGFPEARLKALLREDNLFLRLVHRGRSVSFLNAYPCAYLDALGLPHDPPRGVTEPAFEIPPRLARPAATTVAAAAAGLRFHTLDDVAEGRALPHDLVCRSLASLGVDLPELSPEEAGARLVSAARGHDLAMFEYFLTDKAGHAQDRAAAAERLDVLERALGACLAALDPDRDTLVVTSDHGNLEDLSTRTHTRHPVPLLAVGHGSGEVLGARDLTDVARLLERICA